jgi:hypothetical protein
MSDASDEDIDAHLSDLDDGCGCVEVWAHTSEKRADEEEAGDPATDGSAGE